MQQIILLTEKLPPALMEDFYKDKNLIFTALKNSPNCVPLLFNKMNCETFSSVDLKLMKEEIFKNPQLTESVLKFMNFGRFSRQAFEKIWTEKDENKDLFIQATFECKLQGLVEKLEEDAKTQQFSANLIPTIKQIYEHYKNSRRNADALNKAYDELTKFHADYKTDIEKTASFSPFSKLCNSARHKFFTSPESSSSEVLQSTIRHANSARPNH
ncbi:MAG: hypothetical protein A3F18_05945 [Legionellales bacterium RIFCSPHIGHO2_12_FULL_37_14]|nr:MAG: hypothetical protein A3F18_05945 [Legionellales bacterium RIFCSPHIGHO2_12_FULL_37_14]